MPNEDKTFSGSFVLDLRIWWRQAHTLYSNERSGPSEKTAREKNDCFAVYAVVDIHADLVRLGALKNHSVREKLPQVWAEKSNTLVSCPGYVWNTCKNINTVVKPKQINEQGFHARP